MSEATEDPSTVAMNHPHAVPDPTPSKTPPGPAAASPGAPSDPASSPSEQQCDGTVVESYEAQRRHPTALYMKYRGNIDAQRRSRRERQSSAYDRFMERVALVIDNVERVLRSIQEEEAVAADYLTMIAAALANTHVRQLEAARAQQVRDEAAKEEAAHRAREEAERVKLEQLRQARELQERREREVREREAAEAKRRADEANCKAEAARKAAAVAEARLKAAADAEGQRKAIADAEAKRRAAEQAEAERREAEQQVEAQRRAAAEAEAQRKAAEQAEAERLAAQRAAEMREARLAEARRKRLEVLEAQRKAAEEAEAQRKAAAAAEAARIAAEEAKRKAAADAEAQRRAAEDAEARRKAQLEAEKQKREEQARAKAAEENMRKMLTRGSAERKARDNVYVWADPKLLSLQEPPLPPIYDGSASNAYQQKKRQENLSRLQEDMRSVKAIQHSVQAKAADLRAKMAAAGEVDDTLVEELVLQECLKKGIRYVDLSFPPDPASIDPNAKGASFAFTHPSWYLDEDHPPELFLGAVEPNDISQGMLGDCWFLCSISSVAEFPEQVINLFDHPDILSPVKSRRVRLRIEQRLAGAYRIVLNKDGWWEHMIVDAYLPGSTRPIYAENRFEKNEMWVPILEKAFAKLHGSFKVIEGGLATHAFTDLTGFPSKIIIPVKDQPSEELFNKLCDYDLQHYLMAGAPNRGEREKYQRAGLPTGHAYSLIVVRRIKARDGTEFRLLKIRNPWGNATKFNGSWGDKSPLWDKHPDIKAELDFKPRDDGCFWMTWDEFREWFERVYMCFLKHGWYDYRVKAMLNGGTPNLVLELHVHKPTEFWFILSQKCGRKHKGYKEKAFAWVIAKPKGSNYEPMLFASKEPDAPTTAPSMTFGRDISMFVRLQPLEGGAPYVVYPREHQVDGTTTVTYGILSNEMVGASTYTINFRQVKLKGVIQVEYNPMNAQPVETEYQMNDKDVVPVTFRGTSLQYPEQWR